MRTTINELLVNRDIVKEADAILRKCVHCGFCLATCPTYQLLGNELDSPRGRIYLIKEMLEQDDCPASTVTHLDRCLTCRSCETTCPSGVRYADLLDTGRLLIDEKSARPVVSRMKRWILCQIFPIPWRIKRLLKLGQLFRPMLPEFLRCRIPEPKDLSQWPDSDHPRKMLVLSGCVQSAATPEVNLKLASILDRLGITLIKDGIEACCGAMETHTSAQQAGLDRMRSLIDQWWPFVEAGVERIVTTASGCGVTIKDYPAYLKHDAVYVDKAVRIARLCCDVSEVLTDEMRGKRASSVVKRVAWHSPCSLQHGHKITGLVEDLLRNAGLELVDVRDAHLCCGSAGTYSLLETDLATKLLSRKVDALTEGKPDLIVTANVGCQLHLQSATDLPVRHWIELLSEANIEVD